MTAIASPYKPIPRADALDTYNPELLAEHELSRFDSIKAALDEKLEINPEPEELGAYVAQKVGWVALGMGVLDTTQNAVIATVNSIRFHERDIPYLHLTKDALIVLGGWAILRYGVRAVDRWWNN